MFHPDALIAGAMKTCLVVLLMCSPASVALAQSFDSGVQIKHGEGIGGGYTIANGSQCFVITAAHVVKDSAEEMVRTVSVTDVRGMQRTATPIKESPTHDLALLKIDDPVGFLCNRVWSDGANARNEAKSSKEIFLERHNGAGDERRIQLKYAGNRGPAGLVFSAAYSSQTYKASQGDSGWPIFSISGELLGIAESVSSGTSEVVALSQAVINATFASDVVSNRAYRILASQVTLNGRREYRSGTVSLLGVLQARGGVIPIERDPFYMGTSSWSGNVDAKLARRSPRPPIPDADYLVVLDIVALDTKSEKVPASQGTVVEGVAEDVLTGVILEGIFGNSGREAANRAKRDRERLARQTKTVMDVTLDLDLALTDTGTGAVVRHRVSGTVRIDHPDRDIAEANALEMAIQQGVPALLKKAGL